MASTDPDALHTAAHHGDLTEVQGLVASGTHLDEPARSTSWRGRTPLWLAADGGALEVVRWLLSQGADPNLAGHGGYRPLHVAATLEIATALLAAGADPNAHNSDGDTPLMRAAQRGDVARVRALVDHGANVNARGLGEDPFATSALAYAVEEGHADVVTVLVAAGVDLVAEAAHYAASTMESLIDLAPTEAIAELVTPPSGADD